MLEFITSSPVGNLKISLAQTHVLGLSFTEQASTPTPSEALTKRVIDALNDYFEQPQHYHFELPIELIGTPFQRKVWQALSTIAPGTTLTYGQLAEQLNTSPRAIGNACRCNPIAIIVPCHRVVGRQGLTGFAGQTQGQLLSIKASLLNRETSEPPFFEAMTKQL